MMPRIEDVNAILSTYGGVDQGLKLALLELTRQIRQRGWWTVYGDVIDGSHAELEAAATHIRSWQAQVVPGLLQTEDYARTLIADYVRNVGGEDHDAEIARRVEARMARKARLNRPDGPRFDVVMAEEVVNRLVGGPAVMKQQLKELRAAMDRPNTSLCIIPVAYGAYPDMGSGSMVIFDFPEATDLAVAFVESIAGSVYVEDIDQVRRCSTTFDRLTRAALTAEETALLLETKLTE